MRKQELRLFAAYIEAMIMLSNREHDEIAQAFQAFEQRRQDIYERESFGA